MPVTVERCPNLVLFRFSGEACVEDILEVADWCDEADREAPGLPRFADTTAVTAAPISFGEVVRVTGERRRVARPQAVRIAILVGSDLVYAGARMYQALFDHPQVDLEVFWDRQAAFAYLRVSDPEAG